jgi:ParB family chromosome partitioning protein
LSLAKNCCTYEFNCNNLKVLVIELKEKDIEKPKKDKPKDAYNFTPLNNIVEKLKENSLKVKIEKNYFKIEFNSQEDVDKIISYFNIQS